jgi:hemerythrin superfamily protein
MSICDELVSDHDAARALLSEIGEMSDRASKSKKRAFEQLKEMMTAHSRAEERVFYSALKEAEEAKDDVLEAYEEHHVVDVLLREIARLDPADERWKAKFAVLKQNIEHHAQEEEQQVFAQARGILSGEAAEELGRRFAKERDKRLRVEA